MEKRPTDKRGLHFVFVHRRSWTTLNHDKKDYAHEDETPNQSRNETPLRRRGKCPRPGANPAAPPKMQTGGLRRAFCFIAWELPLVCGTRGSDEAKAAYGCARHGFHRAYDGEPNFSS
jgi:hypothetical protein